MKHKIIQSICLGGILANLVIIGVGFHFYVHKLVWLGVASACMLAVAMTLDSEKGK